MKISRLHVRGFGKLQDFDVDFSDGLNVIYGNNESGKSTLMTYIKAMLYGVKGGRAGKNGLLPDGKRYMPWNNTQYGGYMNFELDDGSTYRIDRDFQTNEVKLFDSSFNDVTRNYIDGRDTNNIAEKLIGLNENLFERTVFVKQMGTRIDTSASKDLVDRISNIQQSGFEDISYVRAQSALKEALKRQVGTDRSYTRPLDVISRRLSELQEKKLNVQAENERLEELRIRQQELSLQINKLKQKDKFFNRAISYCRQKESLRLQTDKAEEVGLLSEAILQTKNNIAELANDKEAFIRDSNNKQMSKGKKLGPIDVLGLLCVLTTVGVGLAAFVFDVLNPFFTAIPLFLAIALFIISIRSRKKDEAEFQKSKKDELSRQLSLFDERITQNQAQCQKLLTRLEGLQLNCKPEDMAAMESEVSLTYIDIVNDAQRIDAELSQPEKELIESLMRDTNDSLIIKAVNIKKNLGWQLQKLETEYAVITETAKSRGNEVNIADIDNEMGRLTRQKNGLDQKGEALNIAINTLEAAAEQVRKKYVPVMNKVFNNTFAGLTAQKYTDVRVGENLNIMLDDPETQTLVPVSMLSDGTIDQIYLSLRVAISETVLETHESMPFIMDEPFAQYDDDRTSNCLKYIGDISRKQQVIIFTCKRREVELISSQYPCKICSLT
jgi:Uncharacterized conserved protein